MGKLKVLESAIVAREEKEIGSVDIALQPGECVQLVGDNGAGKSTILEAIAGFLPLKSGSRSQELADIGTRIYQEELGYLPGSLDNLPHVKLRDWRTLISESYTIPREEVDNLWFSFTGRRRNHLMEDTILPDLSTGNKKKAIALLALSPQRKLLLLDEPFEPLDQEGITAISYRVREQLIKGACLVIVSHKEIPQEIPISSRISIRIR